MSIRLRIILGFLLAVLITVASTAFLAIRQMRGDANGYFTTMAERQIAVLSQHLVDFMEEIKGNVGVLVDTAGLAESASHMPYFAEMPGPSTFSHANLEPEAKGSIAVLTSMQRRHSDYVEVYAGFPDGRFATSVDGSTLPARYNSSTRSWYTLGRDSSSDITMIDAYLSTSGETVIAAVGKVRDGRGKFVSTVGIDVTLKSLASMMAKLNFGNTGHFLLIEQTGRILCDPVHGENTGKTIGKDTTDAALATIKSAQDGPLSLLYRGADTRAVVKTAPNGWKIVALQAEAEIMARSNEAIFSMLAIVCPIALGIIILGLGIALSINRPLTRLVTAMNKVAGGDYKAVPEKQGFYKELLTLRNALSKMVKANVHSLALAQKKSKEAEKAVEKAQTATEKAEEAARRAEKARSEGMQDAGLRLQGVVTAISDAASELSDQIEQSNKSSVESSQRLSDAASAMNQMNVAVRNVARNAGTAASVSSTTRTNAEKGQAVLETAMSSINEVQTVSLKLKEDMNALHEHTRNISQIMDVISDIADQTNLLALNAAIEAARAGEAGRGFAVVADEVRKLAEKTMDSTHDVGSAITAIQASTEQSVARMEEALNSVSQATSLAQQSGEALREIVKNVEDTADQVRAIATASEEQSAATDEITRTITVVNEMSGHTSQVMTEAEKAIVTLADQTEKLTVLVEELKQS